MVAREPAPPPERMVSLSSERRVWLLRICSFSSSMRSSRSRRRTAYVGPSIGPPVATAAGATPEADPVGAEAPEPPDVGPDGDPAAALALPTGFAAPAPG